MKSPKLIQMYALMSLEGAILGAELVASQLTHSLLLLTDAYHTLYNIISILLLVISFKVRIIFFSLLSDDTVFYDIFVWG